MYPEYATDWWDGSYAVDSYCVNVSDATNNAGSCGSGGGGGFSSGSGGEAVVVGVVGPAVAES